MEDKKIKVKVFDPADPRDKKIFPLWRENEEKILSSLGSLREFVEYAKVASIHVYDDNIDDITTHLVLTDNNGLFFKNGKNLSESEIEDIVRNIAKTLEPYHNFKKKPFETVLPSGHYFVGTLPPLSPKPRIDIYTQEKYLSFDVLSEVTGSKVTTEEKKSNTVRGNFLGLILMFCAVFFQTLSFIMDLFAWVISAPLKMVSFIFQKISSFLESKS